MDALSVMRQTPDVNEVVEVSMSKNSTARSLAVMPKPKRKPVKRDRTRGTGHLFQRGTIYWFELHWKGQRYRESLGTEDRQTALIKIDDKIASIRSGEMPKTFESISVQAMYDNWMVEVERTCKPRTIEDYKSRWNTHLKPIFGRLFATQVGKDDVSRYLLGRKKAGAAGDITQNRENRVLQMIFNHNKAKIPSDRFPEFPSMHSEKARVRRGRLSVADFKTLLGRLDDPKLEWLKAILVLTFKFGFRKSELLNAKVKYFDAKASVFTLPAFTTKNDMERRVPVRRDGEIYRMLIKLTAGRDKDAALFTRNGKAVRDYRGAWEKLVEGLTGGSGKGGCITVHDLRRSAITGMSNKGIGAAEAGTHLTADVFNRYISRSPEEEQATAAKIEGD
jgi:integrase